jgi:uncharacterized membrane protein YbhN (UPF0104 family)
VTVAPQEFLGAAEIPKTTRPSWLKRLVLALRLLFPAVAIGYMLQLVPLREVAESLQAIPVLALAIAGATMLIGTLFAVARWRILFSACGFTAKPRWRDLFRAYMIGGFYNVYVPGALGGDVLRALATRKLVAGGLPASVAVVVLERVLGFVAMLTVLTGTFTLFPLPGLNGILLFSGLGFCIAVALVFAIINGPRLAPYLPLPLRRIAASLPQIESLPRFGLALALSLLTQLSSIIIGHVLIHSVSPNVGWSDSLVILPLANAMQYFPLTIGGAGVREAAYVLLYATVGVSKPDALAASFAVGALSYTLAALGGIWHAARPLTFDAAVTETDSPRGT